MKEEGAVIGLPLYILVAVVVAAVALVAIMGFMIKPGPQIGGWKITPDTIKLKGSSPWTGTITVYVYDQNGHPLKGVHVILNGCNATNAGTTNENGKVALPVKVSLPPDVQEDTIKVKLYFHGPAGTEEKQDIISVVRVS